MTIFPKLDSSTGTVVVAEGTWGSNSCSALKWDVSKYILTLTYPYTNHFETQIQILL